MFPYFLIWSFLAIFSFRVNQNLGRNSSIITWIILTIFIGFRIEVGADWDVYLQYLNTYIGTTLKEGLGNIPEPGYSFINWLSANMNWSIYGVNLICGGLVSAAVIKYCRSMPYPWLGLLLSYPYLITVVSMGYVRQGIAVSFGLLAFQALERNQIKRYIGYTSLGYIFHPSAILLIILPILDNLKKISRIRGIFLIGFLSIFGIWLYQIFLSKLIYGYINNYIGAEFNSSGALLRVGSLLFSGLIFLLLRNKFKITKRQKKFYTMISLLTIFIFTSLFVSPSTTLVDRLSLYFVPLQIFVGCHIPDTNFLKIKRSYWILILVSTNLIMLAGWLLFANHASYWLPYRNLLFD